MNHHTTLTQNTTLHTRKLYIWCWSWGWFGEISGSRSWTEYISRVQVTPIPILSKPRLVKLAICGHCGQYSCRVGWVRIRNTGAQCVIWVYGLFWIVYVILLDINVGLILLYLSLIKIPFCLIFVSGTFL